MKKPYNVSLEATHGHVLPRRDIIYISGDAETMPLSIHLMIRSAPLVPKPGAIATLNFKAGGYEWKRTRAFQEDGTLLYDITPSDIAIPGDVTVSVTVTAGEEILTWIGFYFEVKKNPAGNQADPPDEWADWAQDMTTQVSEAKAGVSEVKAVAFTSHRREDSDIVFLNESGNEVDRIEDIGGGTGGAGPPGPPGVDGLSAYELAVQEGFEGTLDEWLASLRGADAVAAVTAEPYNPGAPPESAPAAVLYGSDGEPVLPVTSTYNVLGLSAALEEIPKGKDGESATIEVDSTTTLEPDEPARVTNIGTPSIARFKFEIPRGLTGDVTGQSLYEHSVATGFEGTYDDWLREYLARQTDLDYVAGYFKDRSFAPNEQAALTPVFLGGDASMLDGVKFVAKRSGKYAFVASGALLSVSPSMCTRLVKNDTALKPYEIVESKIVFRAATASISHMPGTAWIDDLQQGDYLSFNFFTSLATSTFCAYGSVFSFRFVRIA